MAQDGNSPGSVDLLTNYFGYNSRKYVTMALTFLYSVCLNSIKSSLYLSFPIGSKPGLRFCQAFYPETENSNSDTSLNSHCFARIRRTLFQSFEEPTHSHKERGNQQWNSALKEAFSPLNWISKSCKALSFFVLDIIFALVPAEVELLSYDIISIVETSRSTHNSFNSQAYVG